MSIRNTDPETLLHNPRRPARVPTLLPLSPFWNLLNPMNPLTLQLASAACAANAASPSMRFSRAASEEALRCLGSIGFKVEGPAVQVGTQYINSPFKGVLGLCRGYVYRVM